VPVREGEILVFWACGVSPAGGSARAAITHSPGCMFVTDVRDETLEAFSEREC
jgi:uncharacterized protein YcsI (UPF0317 family)